jgi:hypothetical protein
MKETQPIATQPVLSRFFDADGTPRDRALWLVFAGMAATLLLAFFVVCVHQVQRAQARHVQAEQTATQDCAALGRASRCDSQAADFSSSRMASRLR